MKTALLTFMMIFSVQIFAQEMSQAKIKSYAKESIYKALNKDSSWYSNKHYLVRDIDVIATSKRVHGNRLYQVIADTNITCIDTREREVELEGRCSVILSRSFRKTALWTTKIDTETQCFCGSNIVE